MDRIALSGLALAAVLLSTGSVTAENPPASPVNTFEGRVLDHQGKPVASAQVAVVHGETGFISYNGPNNLFLHAPEKKVLFFFSKRNGRRQAKANTVEEGLFRIEGLEAGKYNLLAVHPERGIAVVTDVEQPNPGKPLQIKMSPPTFLDVEVHGLGTQASLRVAGLRPLSPLPWQESEGGDSIRVFISPHANFTGDAKFRAGPLPMGGAWKLEVFQPVPERSFSATLLSLPVRLEPGKTETIHLDLEKGPAISGQVLGPKGEPLAQVSVTATLEAAPSDPPNSAERMHGALTDAAGRYTILGLPEGRYRLEAQRWLPRTGLG